MGSKKDWFLDGSGEEREEFFELPPEKPEPDKTVPMRRRTAEQDPILNPEPEPAPTVPIPCEPLLPREPAIPPVVPREPAIPPVVPVEPPIPPRDAGLLTYPAAVESPTTAPALAGVLILTRSRQPVRRGQVFSLKAAGTVIGSGRKSGCVIDDAAVADRHAEVNYEVRDGVNGFYLYPVPRNATFLNGMRLQAPRKLENGDRIEMGGSAMVFFAAPLEDFRG